MYHQGMLPRFLFAVIVAASLVVPAGANANVVIGSNLARVPTLAENSTALPAPRIYTFVIGALPSSSQAPGGIVSPVNGTITSWRIRAGSPHAGQATLRVIKPVGGGQFVRTVEGPTVFPPPATISTFFTRWPIQAGDYIGIDCCGSGDARFFVSAPGATRLDWHPPLWPGAPGPRFPTATAALELALQVEIDPTTSVAIQQAKALKKGKLEVIADVPNPGTLAVSGRPLKSVTEQVTAAGATTVIVKATKAARKKLRADKRVRGKLEVVFTPTGGVASAATTSQRLKL